MLGAGIVGTSIAVHLAKRGLSVALVDRGGPGEGTSYGNAGIIEGNTMFPAGLPVELCGARTHRTEALAGRQLSLQAFLPRIAPWLLAFRAASQPARLIETAQVMRPLLARAVAEHEALAAEAGAERYLRRTRLAQALSHRQRVRRRRRASSNWPRSFGIANVPLDRDGGAGARTVAERRCFATPCIGPAR